MKTPLPVISSDEGSVAAIHSRSLRLIRDLAVYCHLSSPTWQALRTLKHDLEHERARRAVGGKTGRGIRDTRLVERALGE